MSLKENYLYYYFPSSDKKERNLIIDLINKKIKEKGIDYVALATHYQIECKDPILLLSHFEEEIKKKGECKFIFQRFLTDCLNTQVKYINNLKSSISKVIELLSQNQNYNYKYQILYFFCDYLYTINKSLQNINDKNLNETKVRENTDIGCIKKLILFEELNKKNLFSWEWLNILNKKKELFETIEKMHKAQNLDSLIIFLNIISNNINFIQDIIKIFPYSKFEKTKFSNINAILKCIIENAANNKINFKIKIYDDEIYFKFQEEDNKIMNVTVDLKINEENKLLISQDTTINGGGAASIKKYNEYQINNFYMKFLEQAFSSKNLRINKRNILNKALLKINDEIILNIKCYSLNSLFNEQNNLIVNAWSILFVGNNQLIENFLPYFLKNDKNNLENDIFYVVCQLSNELIQEKNKLFMQTKDKILRTTEQLSLLLGTENYLYNLCSDENYLIKKNLKTTKELENAIEKINSELCIMNDILKNINIKNQPISKYKEILSKELLRLTVENNKLRNDNYKKNIIEKLEEAIKDKNLTDNLAIQINNINNLYFHKYFRKIKSI